MLLRCQSEGAELTATLIEALVLKKVEGQSHFLPLTMAPTRLMGKLLISAILSCGAWLGSNTEPLASK